MRIAHHHPGRLRVRAAPFLGDDLVAKRTSALVEAIPGIHGVTHDARSGSFLVRYDPAAADVNGVIATIADSAGLTLQPGVRHRPIAADVVAAVRKIDDVTAATSRGRLDLGALVSAGLATLGVFSFVKGSHSRIPRWDSLVFWAYSVFVQTHLSHRRTTP